MITEEICHLSNGKSVFSSEHNVDMNFFTKTYLKYSLIITATF